MPISLHQLAAIGAVITFTIGISAQTPQQQAVSHPLEVQQPQSNSTPTSTHPQRTSSEPAMNPVADPKAVVTVGNARFTVLTPELIRMEWAANGKFEDHASFVFLNRHMPVPKFEVTRTGLRRSIKRCPAWAHHRLRR